MTKAFDAKTRPPLLAARKVSEWVVVTKSKLISFNISDAFITRIVRDGLGWVEELVGDVPHIQIVFGVLGTVVDRQAICSRCGEKQSWFGHFRKYGGFVRPPKPTNRC